LISQIENIVQTNNLLATQALGFFSLAKMNAHLKAAGMPTFLLTNTLMVDETHTYHFGGLRVLTFFFQQFRLTWEKKSL
jgi:hypothetical protein